MKNLEQFLSSGILELYVLGHTSDEENAELLIMSGMYHAEITHEILEISRALEYLALENAVEPSARLKESVLAKFSEMAAFEIPRLTHFSKIEDYTDWFGPEDLHTPDGFTGRRVKVLGHTAEVTTMIICATEIEGEIHHDMYEKLLVLEGTCEVIIEGKVRSFHKGDLIEIPLHKWHDVVIPEGTVCKAILQRIPV